MIFLLIYLEDFYFAVENFRTNKLEEKIEMEAIAIYELFLVDKARKQININSENNRKITENIDNKQYSSKMFDDCQVCLMII
jgi:hypothetical protein